MRWGGGRRADDDVALVVVLNFFGWPSFGCADHAVACFCFVPVPVRRRTHPSGPCRKDFTV